MCLRCLTPQRAGRGTGKIVVIKIAAFLKCFHSTSLPPEIDLLRVHVSAKVSEIASFCMSVWLCVCAHARARTNVCVGGRERVFLCVCACERKGERARERKGIREGKEGERERKVERERERERDEREKEKRGREIERRESARERERCICTHIYPAAREDNEGSCCTSLRVGSVVHRCAVRLSKKKCIQDKLYILFQSTQNKTRKEYSATVYAEPTQNSSLELKKFAKSVSL